MTSRKPHEKKLLVRRESTNMNCYVSKLLGSMNDPTLINNVLHKLDEIEKIQIVEIIPKMFSLYKLEKKLNDEYKSLKFNESVDCYIVKEFEKLKSLPREINLCRDYNFCNQLIIQMNANSLDNSDSSLKKCNRKLCYIEKNYSSVPLAIPYLKGGFYAYLLHKNYHIVYIATKFNISHSQIKNYNKFYHFIRKFPFVGRSYLSFTFIVKNLDKIISYIEKNDDIKIVASRPFNFFSSDIASDRDYFMEDNPENPSS